MTTTVAPGKASSTAAAISRAVPTGTIRTPGGGASAVGPATSVTSAPRRRATRATA